MAAVIQDDREGAETDKRAGDGEGLYRTAAEDCLGPQQPADCRKQEISSGNLKTKSMLSTLMKPVLSIEPQIKAIPEKNFKSIIPLNFLTSKEPLYRDKRPLPNVSIAQEIHTHVFSTLPTGSAELQ